MGTKLRACMCMILLIVVSLISTYFTFIRHPPPEEILKNQKSSQSRDGGKTFDLDPRKEHTMAEIAEAAWSKWVHQHGYVSIGDVFDGPCESKERILVGKLVVLIDKEHDGVKVRICTNTTFDTPIYSGDAHIVAHYNSKLLYNNSLDLCTAESDTDDQVIRCPVSKGIHYFNKDWPVSPLFPKGEYDVKIAIIDQKKETVLCSLFVLRL